MDICGRRFSTLVFATSQLDVSLSSSHFLIHSLSHLHCTGSCHISLHAKLQSHHTAHTHYTSLLLRAAMLANITYCLLAWSGCSASNHAKMTHFWTASSALITVITLYPKYQTLLIMLMIHYSKQFWRITIMSCIIISQITCIKPIISRNAHRIRFWQLKPLSFVVMTTSFELYTRTVINI